MGWSAEARAAAVAARKAAGEGWSVSAREAAAAARHKDSSLHNWVNNMGHSAYLVGGAVRDPLLGHEIKDEDFMMMAHPEEIKAAVEKAGGTAEELKVRDRLVGIRAHKSGVTSPEGVEIAPPRIEKSTGSGRHDFEIVPHPGIGKMSDKELLADDSQRRDFTVNALYKNVKTGKVEDPTGHGLSDAKNRILRTTHGSSFRDDPLRILRGARFVSTRGFDPEPGTLKQMHQHAESVTALTQKGVSGSARSELDKLLMGKNPAKALRLMRDTSALRHFLPELRPMIGFNQESKYHGMTADEHTFHVVQNVADAGGSKEARMAALFHDSGKPESAWRGEDGRLHYYAGPNGEPAHEDVGAEIATKAMNRLNYPKDEINHVAAIVQNHMLPEASSSRVVKARQLRARLPDPVIKDLLVHRRADLTAKGEAEDGGESGVSGVDRLERMLKESESAPRAIKDLVIGGNDLMQLGVKPGPAIGSTLKHLLKQVVSNPDLNKKEKLIPLARKHLASLA